MYNLVNLTILDDNSEYGSLITLDRWHGGKQQQVAGSVTKVGVPQQDLVALEELPGKEDKCPWRGYQNGMLLVAHLWKQRWNPAKRTLEQWRVVHGYRGGSVQVQIPVGS